MNTDEIIKKYSTDKEHSKRVSFISLLMFQKIKDIFLKLQNFDNPHDLKILEIGAKLHDIGIFFENAYNLAHHKAGAKYIYENCPDDIDEADLAIAASLIRYHRKSFPSDKHKIYSLLSQKQKTKVLCFAAIIRLCDALDCSHLGLIENFDVQYNKNFNILTIILGGHIMFNKSLIDAVANKKDLFEEVFKTKVYIKEQDV